MAETGQTITYGELEATANQGAQLFRSLGLKRGDHIALLLENHPRFFQICWAAQRAGLYYTAISFRLQQAEVEYIVDNCEARVFISSAERRAVVEPLLDKTPNVSSYYMIDGTVDGFESWEDAIAAMPAEPIADQQEGQAMLYSSGTTGYPKGVKKPLPETDYGEGADINLMAALYGATRSRSTCRRRRSITPRRWRSRWDCMRYGTQVVVMEHFDAERALEYIETYRITHSQWVPTMFVRMLKLPKRSARIRRVILAVRNPRGRALPDPGQGADDRLVGAGALRVLRRHRRQRLRQLNSEEWLAHKRLGGQAAELRSAHL